MSLQLRPPRPGEAGVVAALGNAYGRAMGGDPGRSAADVRDDWAGLGDVRRDAWLVERDGVPAGHACLHDDGHGRLFALGWVDPDHAGHGVGAALVAATERRTQERAAAADPALIVLRNAVLRADCAARELLESRGYERAEEHLRMVADLAAAPPAPVWPDGLVAAAFDPGTDGPMVDACIVEAFSNAWSNQAQWREQKVADPRFDRRLWIVARDGDEVCGAALCMPDTFGMGFVESLAVRPPWRRRGLGAALLLESFHRLWRRGERRVGLGVDGDNAGARRLYERLGMRIAWTADAYEREVRLNPGRGNRGPKPAAGVRPA
ncbi:MAG TPA: GNAT family N-acetyltransferase [Gaiellales bacterium]